MIKRFTVAAGYVHNLLQACVHIGLDVDAMMDALAIERGVLDDPEARLPVEQFDACWDWIIRTTADPAVGLRLGGLFSLSRLGLLAYLWMNSRNAREAIDSAVKYWRLVTDDDKTIVVREIADTQETEVRFVSRIKHAPQVFEADLVYFGRFSEQLGGLDLRPTRYSLMHAPLDGVSISDYETALGAPLAFRQSHYGFAFPTSVVERPLPGSQPALRTMLRDRAELMLANLNRSVERDLASRVRECLEQGAVQLGAVAAHLNLSERTLQRRLSAERVSFSTLLDSVRAQRTRALLTEHQLSIKEVAFMLGFADERAFYSACKRWFGRTPSQYRLRGDSVDEPEGAQPLSASR